MATTITLKGEVKYKV